jgi:putative NADH-flavin reductase
MKVAVIGATGQLGMDVAEEFVRNGDQVCRFSHAEIEISSLIFPEFRTRGVT